MLRDFVVGVVGCGLYCELVSVGLAGCTHRLACVVQDR